MKKYDITYVSSNISFLLDCYVNSFKDLNLLIIDKEDKLGGAWQISDARVHLQWVSDEHKSHIETINRDLKTVDNKFEIKGPFKKVKTIDDNDYTFYSLYHINLGSNLFMSELIKKIKDKKNITIVKDDIKDIISENNQFKIIGDKTYVSSKLYLTNNLKLDKIVLNKKEYDIRSYKKTYNHLFIEVKSKKIKKLDVLICEGNGFKWSGGKQFDLKKQKVHQNLYDSLFFMVNVTELYPLKKDTQLYSCRIKNSSFVEDLKKYLIFNGITESDVIIKIIEDDLYTQNRITNLYDIPKVENLYWFTKMNYFKYLVKLKELRK